MSSKAAEVYGWDTAYGILVSSVNKVMTAAPAGAFPEKFSQAVTDFSGDKITIGGAFSDWSITSGGTGLNLHLQASVASLSFDDTTKPANSAKFSGGTVVLQVNLGFIKAAAPAGGATSGTFHSLKVKTIASIVSSSFSESTYQGNYKTDTETAIKTWLNDNPDTFNHVFATVNLNRTAAKGAYSWLLPTSASYAFVERDTLDDSVFGILSMTEGRAAPTTAQISQYIIPASASAGFLISKQRFMSDMLLPSMPVAFPGTTQNDFSVAEYGTELTLVNQDVEIAPEKPPINKPVQDQGTSYPVYLESLTIDVQETEMSINSTSKTNILDQLCGMSQANNQLYPNTHSSSDDVAVWSFCNTVSTFTVQLYDLKSGKQSLKFVPSGTPVTKHWHEASEGMEIAEIVLTVIGVIVTIVIGVLTDGAGFVIAGMLITLLVGLANEIPTLVGIIGNDDAPSIDELAFNATNPFSWPDFTFELTSAGLNDSLQLGGKPSS